MLYNDNLLFDCFHSFFCRVSVPFLRVLNDNRINGRSFVVCREFSVDVCFFLGVSCLSLGWVVL